MLPGGRVGEEAGLTRFTQLQLTTRHDAIDPGDADRPDRARRRYAVHGSAVEVDCAVEAVGAQLDRLLEPFAVGGWPEGFAPAAGTVRPYEQAEVLRHLSPNARPMANAPQLMEIYEEGERFWLVDYRWGMAEVNLLKGQWRSWILPQPKLDPLRCAEMAVLWPMAQLLRARGLH